ncbi:metallophosphoesterase [Chitinimonas sp.]|uniref:metallophosphoesterase n=1 Tax=Chitinimonas sp. TaxID=1934313 RepID=UPI0035B0E862
MARGRGKYNHFARAWGEVLLDALLCRGLLARWSYSLGLHGEFGVSHHDITLPDPNLLPRPIKIAFASDFHAGPSTHPEIFQALADAVVQQQPDLLLLGGDFVSCKAEYINIVINALNQYQAPLGTFAVFGNHDLWADDAHIAKRLSELGVRVLINERVNLPAPFEKISLVGLDDPWTGDVHVASAFGPAQEATLLLMHSPDGLLYLDGQRFEFGFAGHTHGGQICTKGGEPIATPHGSLSRKYVYGKHGIADNGTLFVSRGVGCSTLPIRINANPELIICTLT